MRMRAHGEWATRDKCPLKDRPIFLLHRGLNVGAFSSLDRLLDEPEVCVVRHNLAVKTAKQVEHETYRLIGTKVREG